MPHGALGEADPSIALILDRYQRWRANFSQSSTRLLPSYLGRCPSWYEGIASQRNDSRERSPVEAGSERAGRRGVTRSSSSRGLGPLPFVAATSLCLSR
jgi:hypothetical protein